MDCQVQSYFNVKYLSSIPHRRFFN